MRFEFQMELKSNAARERVREWNHQQEKRYEKVLLPQRSLMEILNEKSVKIHIFYNWHKNEQQISINFPIARYFFRLNFCRIWLQLGNYILTEGEIVVVHILRSFDLWNDWIDDFKEIL